MLEHCWMRLILICKFPKYCMFKIKLLTGQNARCLVNQVISDICLYLLHLFKQPHYLTWFLYRFLFKWGHKMQHSTLSVPEARHLFIGHFLQPSSCDTQIRRVIRYRYPQILYLSLLTSAECSAL